jgi:5'-nucleotidase/UDP-sugar diphosphatase
MQQRWKWYGLALQLLALSLARPVWAETVNLTLLHLNDIYEITPVEGGKRGGLARVAALRQQLLRQNRNTYTVLAGDFFSPSALGTAKVNGQRLAGQQMVAVLNVLGLDYATFGNHEFDLSEDLFRQRLRESKFRWFSGNVTDAAGKAFPGVTRSQILTVKGKQGEAVRVGLVGVTLPSNQKDYVRYRDAIASAQEQVKALQGKTDVIVALTHLPLEQDQQLAATIPEIDLILGGHEHENMQQWRVVSETNQARKCNGGLTPIFKADANARTVYIHDLQYDTQTRCLRINSRLQPITDAMPEDKRTAQVVQQWVDRAFQGFRADGFNPEQAIATTSETLDGLESSVRNAPTNLTKLVAQAMLREVPEAELAIFNSGSIRIDDRIPAGAITQYDVIRILPFGGKVLSVEMKGEILQRTLAQGRDNRGAGGYLQTANVDWNPNVNGWLIQGQPLQPNRMYRVAINDFLMTGQESNLGFLTFQSPDIKLVAEKRDIRFAVIHQLQAQQSAATKPNSPLLSHRG